MSGREATDEIKLSAPALAGERARPPGNRLLGWFLLREQMSRAREAAARFTPGQREHLRRARLAFEVAELALKPGKAVRAGSTAALAASLFQQSIYWALLAQSPEHGLLSPEALWAAVDSAALTGVVVNDAERTELATAMRSTFVELSEGTPEAQRATAALLQGAARSLVANAQRVPRQLEWCRLKRALRVLLLASPFGAVLVLALIIVTTKPDLAKGAPWRVSSVGIECHPEKSDCGGVETKILFHTKLEPNPWFEYDFGAPLGFSSLTIQNRSDFGPERAVPLVVEVSNDDRHFQEIARREDSFERWRPSFPTQHARYLRLRVARESMLHLESVQVHP